MAARNTQVTVETLVQPNTQKARASQLVVETLVQPNTQKVRVTQLVIEVLIDTSSGALLAQVATATALAPAAIITAETNGVINAIVATADALAPAASLKNYFNAKVATAIAQAPAGTVISTSIIHAIVATATALAPNSVMAVSSTLVALVATAVAQAPQAELAPRPYKLLDETWTFLTEAMTVAGTQAKVRSVLGFPATNNFYIIIGREVMLVTAGAGTLTWTVTRAQWGTTAVAHLKEAQVALQSAT